MRFVNWIGIPACILNIGGMCLAQLIHNEDLRHGKIIYRIYCAVCHGEAGHGDGPMSSILKVHVPDLTEINRSNGGSFPLQRVQTKIDATDSEGLGHGTREMPIFGPVFAQTGRSAKNGRARVHDVIEYLKSIQVRASENQNRAP